MIIMIVQFKRMLTPSNRIEIIDYPTETMRTRDTSICGCVRPIQKIMSED